ncbi:MAG: hypothetical protein ACW99G_22830 [Candidatus Thorarchaeota archaeon]|jgi:hypothetical protein
MHIVRFNRYNDELHSLNFKECNEESKKRLINIGFELLDEIQNSRSIETSDVDAEITKILYSSRDINEVKVKAVNHCRKLTGKSLAEAVLYVGALVKTRNRKLVGKYGKPKKTKNKKQRLRHRQAPKAKSKTKTSVI